MFSSIRRYKVRRGSVEELSRRVQEGFVPLVRQMKGFRGYYLINGGPDVLITISVFDLARNFRLKTSSSGSWQHKSRLPPQSLGDELCEHAHLCRHSPARRMNRADRQRLRLVLDEHGTDDP